MVLGFKCIILFFLNKKTEPNWAHLGIFKRLGRFNVFYVKLKTKLFRITRMPIRDIRC